MSSTSSLISRCFFLAGPTAVGKTDVALALAEAWNGEIVGADAFQVYQGLDLLTAKPSPDALARVPHHLIGNVPLSESYSVVRYLEDASRVITEIQSRGRLPIIVGGTGLYFRALTRGLSEAPASDPDLHAELSATPLETLLERLDALDPEAAGAIDRRNPRRVIRALEVILLSGKPFAHFRQEWDKTPVFRGCLLVRERANLYERIDRRTVAMFEAGAVEEVQAILADGNISDTAAQVLGWSQIGSLLRGEIRRDECIALLQQATRHYAKRQLTWFRREPMLTPLTLTAAMDISSVLNSVTQASQCQR